MPISQKEGYFDTLVLFFRVTYTLSVGFKIKPLKKKHFSVIRQKPTQILPWKLLKEATVHAVSI